jgi:hypothetical protein
LRDYRFARMPVKPVSVVLERAARALGYTTFPAPVAILGLAFNGRRRLIHFGFCDGFGCELAAMTAA